MGKDLEREIARLTAMQNQMQMQLLDAQKALAELSADDVKPETFPTMTLGRPFAHLVSASKVNVTHGQGYVMAGRSTYDWPQTGDTVALSAAALADGNYVTYLDITVHPTSGLFDATYKPILSVAAASTWAGVQSFSTIWSHHLLGTGTVVGGKWVKYVTRWPGDIYVPVFRVSWTNTSDLIASTNVEAGTASSWNDLNGTWYPGMPGTSTGNNQILLDDFGYRFILHYARFVVGWYDNLGWDHGTGSTKQTQVW